MPKLKISNIVPYPHQPIGRTRNTTELQSSIANVGLLNLPGVVPLPDGKYCCLYGWRRVTALRAMGETEVSVEVRSDLMDDPLRQAMVFAQSNIQQAWSELDSADFIKALVDDEGRTLKEAARIRGVSETEALHFYHLGNAPAAVRALVGRGDGKLAYGTFKSELSYLPPERMLESLDGILEVIAEMRKQAAKVALFIKTATPEAVEEVELALGPVREVLDGCGSQD